MTNNLPKNRGNIVELVQKVNEKIKRIAQEKGITEEEVILDFYKRYSEPDENPSDHNITISSKEDDQPMSS